MKTGQATGLQIAFFTFAVLLLAAPAESLLLRSYEGSADEKAVIARAMIFAFAALLILLFPALRRRARQDLATPIPASRRAEVAVVVVAKLPLPWAVVGATALGIWALAGAAGVEQRMRFDAQAQLAWSFSWPGLVTMLLLGTLVAPVLEELVFRGFLYRAFERQWGWLAAMLLSSALFGVYHPNFLNAFASGLVFAAVMRRTGSLRAPIVAHAVSNLMLWHPLLGQFLFPSTESGLGDIATWRLQIACLIYASVALPAYLWMARRAHEPADRDRAAA